MMMKDDRGKPDLERAKEHLEGAIAHLRGTLVKTAQARSRKLEAGDQDSRMAAGELATLKAEHEKLALSHKKLQDDYRALKAVAETVSRGIDGVVGELTDAVEA